MTAADRLFNDGAAYERLMGRWSRRVGELFLEWVDAPKNLRWIDIGCGTGAFTEELIKRRAPAAVTAIDPSDDQLAYARKRSGAELAEFQVGNAQALAFPDGGFDIAVMALVVHFVSDPAKAVAEMARVVRPGGWVTTYVWDYSIGGSPTAPLGAALKSLAIASTPPPSAKATSMQALEALWRAAGLTAIETRVIRIPVVFADFEDYWGSMSGPVGPIGKTIAELSPQAREQLRERLKETASVTADGRIVYEACANAIKGRKPS